uniref:Secreted protein n=1 Tax=Anopheles quadriannulatus TaxID=34691 RepID=A0A182XTI0_ANOQN
FLFSLLLIRVFTCYARACAFCFCGWTTTATTAAARLFSLATKTHYFNVTIRPELQLPLMPSDDRDDDDDDDEVTCLRGALCCFASYAKGFGLFVCLAGWLTGRLSPPGGAYGRFVSKMYLFVCVCVCGFSFSALFS